MNVNSSIASSFLSISAWTQKVAIALTAALSFTNAAPVNAQSTLDMEAARTQLIGARPRTWVKERVVLSMGSHDDCFGGETYRFNSKGTVTVTRCVNHKLVTQAPEPDWKLNLIDGLDIGLAFDGRKYLISFGGPARAPRMRWRHLGSSKVEPTEDIYLSLSKD